MDKFRKLQLDSLDRQFAEFKKIDIPQKGWISTIRSSLSMTLEQLAKRLNVSTPAVSQFEKNEAEGNINLKTLIKVAQALDCQLVYTLVPQDKSLYKILKNQADLKAKKIVKNVDDNMALEKQQVKDSEESIKLLSKELLENYNSKIWSDD